jgi:hypothetical protein
MPTYRRLRKPLVRSGATDDGTTAGRSGVMGRKGEQRGVICCNSRPDKRVKTSWNERRLPLERILTTFILIREQSAGSSNESHWIYGQSVQKVGALDCKVDEAELPTRVATRRDG